MKLKMVLAVTGALFGAPALGCSYPAAPAEIPDGKTAGKDAMLTKKKEIDRYKRDVEAYSSCESNPLRVKAAQAELDRVANRFNAEVRAFKTNNSDG